MRGPTRTMERESIEVRPVYVRSVDEAGQLVDVTVFTAAVARCRPNQRPTVWVPVSWSTEGPFDALGGSWAVEVEFGGPSSGAALELPVGENDVYVKVDTGTEQPVIRAGRVTVL